MGYLENGYLEKSLDVVTESRALLSKKVEDPIGAAVGAYALLELGKLDSLNVDWTKNLKELFDMLPDGAAIYGEHLARLGKHAQAFSVFLEILERGLPIFTKGFSFVLDRLNRYLSVTDIPFSESEINKAEKLLGKLREFAPFVDFEEYFWTFTGLIPDHPDHVPLNREDYNDISNQGSEIGGYLSRYTSG